jgi:transcriptional regulator GlxA family with amidase domain
MRGARRDGRIGGVHVLAAIPPSSDTVHMPRHIAMLAFPRVQPLDAVGPLEVFGRASRWLAERHPGRAPAYTLELLAPEAGPFPTSSRFALVADRAFGRVRGGVDTLLVAGGLGVRDLVGEPRLRRWLKAMAPRVRRLASVCTGAFLLADAGLLDGRRATTHWSACAELAERWPRVRVEADPIYVRDGRVYTSAGVTAGMDLALALVEEDHGREPALEVARELVLFLRRPGGQSQFSAQLQGQLADRAPLRDLQAYIVEHPSADLSVPALARRAAMSERNFARVFARELGASPGRFVERARVETARRLLEETALGVEEVAGRAGFGAAESLRRAFVRNLRVAPSAYRERFKAKEMIT